MRKSALLALASASLMLNAAIALAQPAQIWSASVQYPRTQDSKCVVDSNGNVFVADAGDDGTNSPTVTKFTPDGQVAWIGYGPHEPRGGTVGIKLTPDGGVIAGFHHEIYPGRTDSTVQKFTANGVLQWYRFNQASFLQDFDVDSNGYFYGDYGTFVIKRKPNAQTVWTVSPSNPDDYYSRITVDQNGGAYLQGYTRNTDPLQSFFAHITSGGSVTQVASPVYSQALKVSGGAVYGDADYFTGGVTHHSYVFKLDSDMNVLWTTPCDANKGDGQDLIDVDSQGNLYVASEHDSGGQNDPVLVAKFDTNGNLIYSHTFAGDANREDHAEGLAVNANGEAFVLMTLLMRPFAVDSHNVYDYGIIRYDAAGNTVWPDSGGVFHNGAIIYDSGLNEEFGGGLGLDKFGNVLIGGTVGIFSNPQVYEIVAAKFGTTDGSSFVSQSVPTHMKAGHQYQVTLTFVNTGTSTWATGDGYTLETRNPTKNLFWGPSDVASGTVFPGATKSFTFTVTAPSTSGYYNFQWMLNRNGVGGFGATSSNISIHVTG